MSKEFSLPRNLVGAFKETRTEAWLHNEMCVPVSLKEIQALFQNKNFHPRLHTIRSWSENILSPTIPRPYAPYNVLKSIDLLSKDLGLAPFITRISPGVKELLPKPDNYPGFVTYESGVVQTFSPAILFLYNNDAAAGHAETLFPHPHFNGRLEWIQEMGYQTIASVCFTTRENLDLAK